MKLRNLNILIAAASVMLATSCTNRFEEMNDNDYTSGDMDPKYQFVKAQTKIYSSGHEGYRGNLIMTGPMSMTTMNPQYTQGAGFGRADSYTNATWETLYKDLAKDIEDARVRLEKQMDADTELENQAKLAQLAITRVICYYRTTSLYGDIPYSEAGKGLSEGIFYPKYDDQEFVFEQMVEELKTAREDLNTGATFTDDVYYNGDASKWGKLANSMLIKIGMAMSEANPALGEEIVRDAATHSAGYISDLSDSALFEHNETGGAWGETVNGSGVANEGRVGGQSYQFFSDAMLVSLQERKDPRIFWVASHIDNTGPETKAFLDTAAYTNFDPFKYDTSDGTEFQQVHYRGAKSGDRPDGNRGIYELNGQVKHMSFTIANEDKGEYYSNLGYKFKDQGQYAQLVAVNPATILNAGSTTIVVGADEINFLLAEAAQRGWAVPGSAAEYYRKGVEAAVRKYPSFYASGQDYVNNFVDLYKRQQNVEYIWEVEASNYVDRAVAEFNNSGDKMNTIIYQHWVSQIGNGYNAFALWNRTHLPDLVPTSLGAADRDIQVPVYGEDPLLNVDAKPTGTSMVELHTGGYTNGYRPARLPYPAREFTVNPTHVANAISNQEEYGNPSSDFLTAPQWMSKKN
ncbi:SusD/RagB family nutrient-binding outer membrane lipoprotein [Flammeovirga sp. EKP202]|uniref:SusD/RagB family nutrient-binding outer membrane lipoprotein n=1 Tax=Flammeovirga sp. EKP202 TaxID=2770592 RepID=UPI00165F5D18|nr:SusD/RagB family nutrient-binding outer membrane lipoprotein [Flammeovirga sp. EKP202]MBD0402908.1 SusD/RagB family nutrient-binding outer membrane lipoprotein [Flammeovirga sp. EKP202]